MLPEAGNFTLALALALSLLLGYYPLRGAAKGERKLMSTARPLTYALWSATLFSFFCLVYAFAVNDFTVAYVVNHSNSRLPLHFRLAALWGAHEGSLLLWVTLMACWMLALARCSRQMPLDAVARVLAVMSWINSGFLLFILLASNPFLRTPAPFPPDGRDLNPMLQDPGLIFHPPLLYMGYVGFSVTFAFAINALLSGSLDTRWARWSRPWALAAWLFLTLGIALGSYWAYYELGWGGWWFWDPVENASLMPWLAGTALIHSLVVTAKRGVLPSWTLLLAIFAFSLCLLATFLVRSGILVSVHAFASDPARGMLILLYLLLVIGSSLLLYALKGGNMPAQVPYHLLSREALLSASTLLLVAALLVVLLGTLLPLVHKGMGLGSLSVGGPFFNTLFLWLMVPFALLLGVGPLLRWRQDQAARLKRPLLLTLLLTLPLSILLPWRLQGSIKALAVLGLMMALWMALLTLYGVAQRGLAQLSRRDWGRVCAHLGVAVLVVGITFSENYSVVKEGSLRSGDSLQISHYRFLFRGVQPLQGSNYLGTVGTIEVFHQDRAQTVLRPEKRYYPVTRSLMTEVAIDAGLLRDLYVALGEELNEGAWAIRVCYKPFVRWIWFGALFMAMGGMLAMGDLRPTKRRGENHAS